MSNNMTIRILTIVWSLSSIKNIYVYQLTSNVGKCWGGQKIQTLQLYDYVSLNDTTNYYILFFPHQLSHQKLVFIKRVKPL